MYPKDKIIQHLQTSIFQAHDDIERLSTSCDQHDLASRPAADACPCQAKLYWQLDRLDESIYRLKTKNTSVPHWWSWYLWSSTKSPRFPKESVTGWSQSGQPMAAWQKYGVAQRNGRVEPGHQRAYVYYQNGREHGSRPAAGPHL